MSQANATPHEKSDHHSLQVVPLLICLGLGLAGWFCPHPSALTDQAWHLVVIFVVTVFGLII
ncbi:MAG TPA: hypothetical protein PLD88_14275, partial [Candidatus Berkiella sp.]|nr:hypothetical protein [Candidatus Berkiella sp.]